MQTPERFTILVENHQKPDVVLRKVKAILKEMELDENQYRVYKDGNIKTVINVIIDELFSEAFILEALNRQIRFVATNEKIRRIMSLISNDIEEAHGANEYAAGKTTGVEELNEEFEESIALDSSTVKFAEMLQQEDPLESIDEAGNLIEMGEEIILRAKDVLVTTVENEIKKAVKSTLNNPRNINKSLKVLKDLMTNDILNEGEFKELSQKAGFNIIKLVSKNKKYLDELVEIINSKDVDDFVRIKSAIAYIDNLQKQRYSFSEIKGKINLEEVKSLYAKTQKLLPPEEARVLHPILSE